MNGLYALKPWYSHRLTPLRDLLVARNVSPNLISVAGVAAGAGAGLVLALVRPGPIAAVAVALLLAGRLALANLDGAVARQSGRQTRLGSVINELGDRLAELAALAGCVALAPSWLVATAALAASAPSWISLAGAAAGTGPERAGTGRVVAGRIVGGPVGKTERCLILVLIAAFGQAVPLLAVLAAGSLLTAALRFRRLGTVAPC